jgi:endoglucanase
MGRLPVFVLLTLVAAATQPIRESSTTRSFDQGGIIRGDTSRKRIALIFTGGDFGEGTEHILDVVKSHHIHASVFVTGGFLRKPEYVPLLKRAIAEGHYVGPHSDRHLLYCSWDHRDQTLIADADFKADLQKNVDDLRALGALVDRQQSVFFRPPYEWFNRDQSAWAKSMNVQIFNFTPGSGSNRDYLPETEKKFVSSQKIIDDILAYERKDPHGLNGFLLLQHLGSERKDKPFNLLEPLLTELLKRRYEFVKVDEMLGN